MRKNLLLASLLFAGGLFTMNAQIWSDNFDEGVSNWTMIDADGDGFNWEAIDLGAPNTPAMASYSYSNELGAALTPNNYAISPAIDLTSATGSLTLSWKAKGQDPSWAQERYTVYVATGNTVADFLASSVNYSELVTDNGAGGVFYTKTLDISSFAGETIYIAFRHHDVTDMFSLHIDDVEVQGTASVDNALAGSFSVYPNPVKDALNISNSIGAEINSVTITDINGRIVKQVTANGVESQINIADLNAGVYFVNINSNQGSLTKKIVKQ
jgi:hypothetical protein